MPGTQPQTKKAQSKPAQSDKTGKPTSLTPKDVLRWIKFFFDSFKMGDLVMPLLMAKLPAEVRKYMTYVIGAVYLLLVGTQIVWPVFFSSAYRKFWKANKDSLAAYNTARPILIILLILPILIGIGFSVWRWLRQKNMQAQHDAFKKDLAVVLLRPRGDDKSDWRKSYASFWAGIHGIFTIKEQEVLLQKTPYGSFELLKFSPLLSKSSYPSMVLAVGLQKNQLPRVINQLRSLHNDIIIERPEKEPLEQVHKDEGDSAKVMYIDYSPAGPATSLLDTDVEGRDCFRELATILSDIPTGVMAAGVHLLVRDTLNMYAVLEAETKTMTLAPDGKHRPLDKNSRETVDKLEQKKASARNSSDYDIAIRLYTVGAKEEEMKATMEAMSEWVSRLGATNQIRQISKGDDWATLVERRFPEKHSSLSHISPAEMMPIWHVPDVMDRVDGLERAGFRMLPPPGSTIIQANESARMVGYYLTSNGEKLPVGIRSKGKNPDVFYHVYVVGPTGVGKSVQLLNHIFSDMNTIHETDGLPFSVIVIEPHEDLTKDVLKRVPDNREKDVVILDPLDPWPFGLNMMETTGDPDMVDGDAMTVMASFRKASGPSWDQAVRMQRLLGDAVNTVMRVLPRRGIMPTVMHLQSFLTNPVYRADVIEGLTSEDGNLINSWVSFSSKSEAAQGTEFEPATNRLNKFLNNPVMRRIIAQPYLSIDWEDLMNGGGIVMCKMNGLESENRSLIGSLMTSSIFKTAMGRSKMEDITKRHPTGLFIDEFQTFVSAGGEELKAILAEARKMRLGLTMANQFFNQLPKDVQDAVANNTGTKIVFRTEPQDAGLFEKIFLGKLAMTDFVGLNRYMAHCRLMAKSNIEAVTVFTYPEPPIPPDKEPVATDRDLHKDTADRMRVKLVACKGVPANSLEALGHVMRLATTPALQRDTHAEVVKFLKSIPDKQFTEFQELRKKWAMIQRELLLANPGYIPKKRQRLEQLSRLRVGVPAWEVDAQVSRLFGAIQGMAKAKEDSAAGGDDFFDEMLPASGGAKSTMNKKNAKKGSGASESADLFDSF